MRNVGATREQNMRSRLKEHSRTLRVKPEGKAQDLGRRLGKSRLRSPTGA